jgi:4-amino-4-deoxy-L-arabinose transferase-like glycosyltransferase
VIERPTLAAALAALTLLMVAGIGRLAGFSIPSIVLGLAAVAGMPMAVWSASVMKNDFTMACFQAASIYACLKPVRDGSSRWLFLSGILLGAAFGVKPTALFAAVPIGLIWMWDCRRRPDWLRILSLTGACFALTAFIWPARTYILTGDAFLTAPPSNALGALDPTDPKGPLNHLGRYVEIAVDAHIRGDKGIFELPIRSPFGVMTTVLVGGVLLRRRKRPDPVALRIAVIGIVSLLYWVSTMRTARYGITPILLTPFLLSPGFLATLTAPGPKMRAAMSAVLVYGLVFALPPTLIISNSWPQLRNLAGRLSDDDYVNSFGFHNAFRSSKTHFAGG